MHVCLFDIDGTLIHTGGAGTRALREALRTAFGVERPSESVAIHGRTDRGITRDLFACHGIEENTDHWELFRAAYLEHLKVLLPQTVGCVLPGIVVLLETLASRDDVALGLLTGNTREGAARKLAHYGLDHYFAFGGFGDLHFDRDDVAREAYREAQAWAGGPVEPNQFWVIGDTPADVRSGRAIGALTLAVGTGAHTLEELAAAGPDHLASDLSDLEPILALWP
jgi:phosphoglycolate phosphatase-like HAD superfamily hydrolase